MSSNSNTSVKWQHSISGIAGGSISAFILHPLDLIKIRFQVNEGTGVVIRPSYYGIIDALKSIKQSKGYLGLYQGVTPNMLGSGTAWGLYFVIYNYFKEHRQEGDFKKELPKYEYLGLAALSGAITLVFTNPIWVVKTRLCLQYENELRLPANTKNMNMNIIKYTGIFDCLRSTFKMEGIRGLYKGFVPGLFGVSHGGVQFLAYESLKNHYNNWYNQEINSKLSPWKYLLLGSISKVIAASTTYPYQVIRSRLQDQHRHYSGIWEIISQLWRYEGIRGFYKGIIPSLLRVTPASGITFVVYEISSSLLMPSRHT